MIYDTRGGWFVFGIFRLTFGHLALQPKEVCQLTAWYDFSVPSSAVVRMDVVGPRRGLWWRVHVVAQAELVAAGAPKLIAPDLWFGSDPLWAVYALAAGG